MHAPNSELSLLHLSEHVRTVPIVPGVGPEVRSLMMRYVAVICIALLLGVSTFEASAHSMLGQQRQTPVLRGQVRDELGGAIVRAKVTATDISGAEKIRLTDNSGFVNFDQLPSGSLHHSSRSCRICKLRERPTINS